MQSLSLTKVGLFALIVFGNSALAEEKSGVRCFADNAEAAITARLCGMVNAKAKGTDQDISNITLRMKKVSKSGVTARLDWREGASAEKTTGDMRISVRDGVLNSEILNRFAAELTKGLK